MENVLLQNINLIEFQLESLPEISLNHDEVLNWFKALCTLLTEIVNNVGRITKKGAKLDVEIRDSLLLYLTQLLTSLSLLIRVFLKEETIREPLLEGRRCVSRQLDFCLKGVQSTLKGSPAFIPAGNFVKWMDNSLDKLAIISTTELSNPEKTNLIQETRNLFEEVLSHAMSIAQVCLEQDRTIIRGGCQIVLENLNILIAELEKVEPNPDMINIFVDTCSMKLCNLERKVNTAVLRLCLKTFTQYVGPLQKLKDFCEHGHITKSDLFDDLVVDFDLHVDRIMQIALFAVSCSSDAKRGIEIRSCLASLESMESELVPSFSAFLQEPSINNLNYASLLEEHWLKQAKMLQKFIFLILDPFAFCEVIYEEALEIVNDLKSLILRPKDVVPLIEVAEILKIFLNLAQLEFSEDENLNLEENVNKFTKILDEVKGATRILLKDDDTTLENSSRVLKRCKILLTMMKRIWYCFALNPHEKSMENKEIPSPSNVQPVNLMENPFLNHIIKRGKQILQDRSILYKSPMKIVPNQKFQHKLPSLTYLKRSSFTNLQTKNETSLELQISAILSEITNLSTTFSQYDK